MIKYVYICAAGHSGSTLLDLLVSSHSRCASLGEITYLPKNIALNMNCMCGAKVPACPLWTRVLDRLGEVLGGDFRSNPYLLKLGYVDSHNVIDRSHQTRWYELQREIMHGLQYLSLRFGLRLLKGLIGPVYESFENNVILYDVVREVTGAQMVVDSSKTYLKAIGIYQARPDAVRILHLVRDGRAVFYSGIKREVPWAQSLQSWHKHYARALPLLARHVRPEHIMRVKYEDLAREPRRELTRICAFLGLPFEEGMLDFGTSQHHLINGNAMKYSAHGIRFDREWQDKLSDEALAYFERHAGAFNRSLGYT